MSKNEFLDHNTYMHGYRMTTKMRNSLRANYTFKNGLFYRPPNSDANYYSNIEDSLALAFDTGIADIIVTGDFNFNLLNPQTARKIDSFCTQFSLYQSVEQPTHFTEISHSLIDIILVSNKNNLILSGVGDPFPDQE